MNDLTDKWNKGELPEGDYYIKRRNGYIPYDNIDSKGVWRNSIDEDIIKVLAPVPSYEEWQKHRKTLLKTQEKNCDLEIINTQLKELLKECRDEIDYLRKHYKGNIDHLKNNTRLDKGINQALGEDK